MSECLSEGGGKRKRPFFIQGEAGRGLNWLVTSSHLICLQLQNQISSP